MSDANTINVLLAVIALLQGIVVVGLGAAVTWLFKLDARVWQLVMLLSPGGKGCTDRKAQP